MGSGYASLGKGDHRRGPNAAAGRYRGPDRRGLIATSGPIGHTYVVALYVLLTVALAIVFGAGPADVDGLDIGRLSTPLEGVALAAAALLAALCVVRWRLVGEAAALYLGIASGCYAVFVLGPAVVNGDELVTGLGPGWSPAGGRLAIFALVVLALVVPEVDTRVRPLRLVAATAFGAGVATFGAAAVPQVGQLVLTPAEHIANGASTDISTGSAALAAWVILGALASSVGFRRRRPLLAWFGLGMIVLAAAEATPLWSDGERTTTALAAVALQVTAFLTIGAGAVCELFRAFRDQDGRLLASVTSARSAEARLEADLAVRVERAHEAQNVLLAIETATVALQRYQDQIGADDRAALSSSISSEVQRLQRLVDVTPVAEELGRFRPSEALASLVTCARYQGARITVDVPDDLAAIGRPIETAQVLNNLLENARRYGGEHITVRATLEDDHVVVRVSDDGPGLTAEERDAVFERGVRGEAAAGMPGRGLGLFISRRLMEGQGGELRLDPPAERGACFAVVLPGFSVLSAQPVDGTEKLAEAALPRRRLHVLRPVARHGSNPRPVEEEDHVGDVVAW